MIVTATLADVPELNLLVNSAYRGESSREGWTTEADFLEGTRIFPEELQKLIDLPGSMILKYLDGSGQIKGCVNIQEKDAELYLGLLTVNPKSQGQGIGRQLLKAAEALARSRGIPVIKMTVVSIRSELIEWYRKNGYHDTGERAPFPTGDPRFGIPLKKLEFIVMKKNII